MDANLENSSKKDLVIELTNLIGSSQLMVSSFDSTADYLNPQFVLPLRRSAFQELAKKHPTYQKLYNIMDEQPKKLFKLPVHSKVWLDNPKSTIKDLIEEQYECN